MCEAADNGERVSGDFGCCFCDLQERMVAEKSRKYKGVIVIFFGAIKEVNV